MLSCFDVLISLAKQGEWRLDPEPELNLLYGQQPSLEGAYLRNVFRRFVAAESEVGPLPSESRAVRAAERGEGVSISASSLSGNRHGVSGGSESGAGQITPGGRKRRRALGPESPRGRGRARAPAAAPDPVCRQAARPAPLPAL